MHCTREIDGHLGDGIYDASGNAGKLNSTTDANIDSTPHGVPNARFGTPPVQADAGGGCDAQGPARAGSRAVLVVLAGVVLASARRRRHPRHR